MGKNKGTVRNYNQMHRNPPKVVSDPVCNGEEECVLEVVQTEEVAVEIQNNPFVASDRELVHIESLPIEIPEPKNEKLKWENPTITEVSEAMSKRLIPEVRKVANCKKVNVRGKPSLESSVVTVLPLGSKVYVELMTEDGWARVRFGFGANTMRGYILAGYIV